MSGTLIPSVTYQKFRSLLFEAVYPHHTVNDHLSVSWQEESLLISWYESVRRVYLQEIWDYSIQCGNTEHLAPLEMVSAWVEVHMLPTYEEVVEQGVPMFNITLRHWEFAVYRNGNLMLLPAEEVTEERKPFLAAKCLDRLQPELFRTQQKDAVVSITSSVVPSCAVLFDNRLLEQVVNSTYDLSHHTRLLVSADHSKPVFIGHYSAINRLSAGMEDQHTVLNLKTLENLG